MSSESDVSKFNRRRPNDRKGDKSSVVDNEVKRLFRENPNQISTAAMYKLRERYGDEELLDQIQDAFIEKTRDIRKRAKKFARMISERYSQQNFPLHILLRKALKYKKKYNLSDGEFEEFRRIYESQLTGDYSKPNHINVTVPFTNMSRALGQGNVDVNDGMKFQDRDYETIKHIVRTYAEKKPVHNQVVLQHISYRDLAPEALSGKYNSERHNPHCHVHPVLAALFLPKIKSIDDHMLLANIAYIVKQRYTKQPILTQSDYELFYDLISDPDDVVCSSESPIKDLLHRAQLQGHIWDSVLSLRNGRYYDCNNTNFLVAVDNCQRRSNSAPDLVYKNDEGTIMQRILAAFSFRPTVVKTTPLYGVMTNNALNTTSIVPKVHSRQIITLNIGNIKADKALNLEDSLDESQWYVEDGVPVPKNQEIIYSKGVIMFYVPRRHHTVNIGKVLEPYAFNRLPATVAGFERLNSRLVNFDFDMGIPKSNPQNVYKLKSVVIVDYNKTVAKDNGPKIVTGASTLLVEYGAGETVEYWYNPRDAGVMRGSNLERTDPVARISNNGNQPAVVDNETFWEKASRRGTIFVYAVPPKEDLNKPDNILPFM